MSIQSLEQLSYKSQWGSIVSASHWVKLKSKFWEWLSLWFPSHTCVRVHKQSIVKFSKAIQKNVFNIWYYNGRWSSKPVFYLFRSNSKVIMKSVKHQPKIDYRYEPTFWSHLDGVRVSVTTLEHSLHSHTLTNRASRDALVFYHDKFHSHVQIELSSKLKLNPPDTT